VAALVVDPLEVVEIEVEHRGRAVRTRQRLVQARDEQRAVGQIGQRVAVGLLLQALLQLAHAADRLLEAVELERHARVLGQRLEQPQITPRERRLHALAVAEDHHAGQPRLAGHRGDQRLLDATCLQVAAQLAGRLTTLHEHRALVLHAVAQRRGERRLERQQQRLLGGRERGA
jgi:hypothetical protein